MKAAAPSVALLDGVARGTPEVAKDLSLVLGHLDDRGNAVEKDPRSPGGQGYTGFEALLQYVYDQTTSTATYDANSHIFKIALFASKCGNYANAQSVKNDPSLIRDCSSYLGPTQPGITTPDVDALRRARPRHCAPGRRAPHRPDAAARPGPARPRGSERARPAAARQRAGAGPPDGAGRRRRGRRDAAGRHRPAGHAALDPRAAAAAERPDPVRAAAAAAGLHAGGHDAAGRRGPGPVEQARRAPSSSSTTCSSHERRPPQNRASVVASPVLVGAVTVLVVVVAVFLAYNANSGLPFVPTTQLKVDLANGANLVPGNEVRSGGFRVGVVSAMEPVRLPGGTVGAQVTLKLDRKLGAIPADSQVTVRPRSALGLKYVELDRGRSERTLADGATLPRRQTRIPVELDQVLDMFDAPTRRAAGENLVGFGDALNGRGADINETIGRLPELEDRLTSVMANLADPRTNIQGFFSELDDAARVVAPVSKTNARLFTTMADTFGAISADEQALKDTIAKAPGTLDTGTRSLRVQRPFLEHTAALSADLDAAAVELRRALPDVNRALATATPGAAPRCTSSTSRCSRPSTRSTASSRRRRRTGRCAACRRPSAPSRRRPASSARTSRSATTGTTSGRSRPSTSRRPTTPAARSARC